MEINPNQNPSPSPRPGQMIVLVLAPFLIAVVCIGLGALALATLGERAAFALLQARSDGAPKMGIPVTGGEPFAPAPAQPEQEEPSPQPQPNASGYLLLAQDQMTICYDSFGAFVDLEQLVFEDPGLFQDESYRENALQAAEVFRADCQALQSLPEAPPAYRELDLWLRRSADAAGLAVDNFASALDAGEAGSFSSRSMHLTVEHLLNFIDYTHNAASVLESLSQRRDL